MLGWRKLRGKSVIMKSSATTVTALLLEVKALNPDQHDLMQALRTVVKDVLPDAKERVMYGGIMFSGREDWGGIFASKNHVSFEFSQGFSFDDPQNLLEGTGKFRRHLKLKTLDDIAGKNVAFFVGQA